MTTQTIDRPVFLAVCPVCGAVVECWAGHDGWPARVNISAYQTEATPEDAARHTQRCYRETQWRRDPRMVARRMRRIEARKGRVLPFYVVCYGIDRRYGGPEEGGWWYDATAIIDVAKVWDVKGARAALRRMRDDNPTCPRGRGSVLGGTDIYVRACAVTAEFPTEDDGSKPRYE